MFEKIYTILSTENEMLFILFSMPLTFITSYFYVRLCCKFLNISSTIKKDILFTIINSLLMIFGRVIMPAPYYRVFHMIFSPLTLFLVYRTSLIKTILSDVIMFLIVVSVDIVFSFLYCDIYEIGSFQEGITVPIYKLSLIFTIMLVMIIWYCIVSKFKLQIKLDDNETKENKIRIVVVSTVGLIIMTLQLWEVVFFGPEVSSFLTLTNVIAMSLYFFLSVSNIVKIESLKKANICISNLESYNKTLKTLYDDIRAFKHDFSNIMQVIGGYIASDDMDGLKKYYNGIFKDCKSITTLEILNPELFNNPAIYNIVSNKVLRAKELGIEMNVSVFTDLNQLNMKIYEATRILGILLDNAIEASQECDTKIINVEFLMNKSRNMQLIKIDNTYKDKNIDTEKIFEKDYSTKPGNTGLGLWEIRQILNKNSNLNLFTSKDNEYFKQQLEIYV